MDEGALSFGLPWVNGVEQGAYDIAFSDDHFLRSDGTESACFDRNSFDETAWRYGLYDATTGARVSPQSGFPVTLTESGMDYYGWVGYWGVWFPEELDLESGTTVYKQTFGRRGRRAVLSCSLPTESSGNTQRTSSRWKTSRTSPSTGGTTQASRTTGSSGMARA